MTYAEVRAFHGHSCPGLAKGYVMSRAALEALGEGRAPDEELVAIVENDACGVDALQCLTGCTLGKGNLLLKDHGKQAYTLLSRATGRGVRVSFDSTAVPAALRQDRAAYVAWILSGAAAGCLAVRPAAAPLPPPARTRRSLRCPACGESVMETRLRMVGGRRLCLPCAEAAGSPGEGPEGGRP